MSSRRRLHQLQQSNHIHYYTTARRWMDESRNHIAFTIVRVLDSCRRSSIVVVYSHQASPETSVPATPTSYRLKVSNDSPQRVTPSPAPSLAPSPHARLHTPSFVPKTRVRCQRSILETISVQPSAAPGATRSRQPRPREAPPTPCASISPSYTRARAWRDKTQSHASARRR